MHTPVRFRCLVTQTDPARGRPDTIPPMESDTEIVGPHSVGVLEQAVDDDLIVFNPITESYFTLNRTAREVWDLANGTRTAGDILETIAERYGVAVDDVRADISEIIDNFRKAGLL